MHLLMKLMMLLCAIRAKVRASCIQQILECNCYLTDAPIAVRATEMAEEAKTATKMQSKAQCIKNKRRKQNKSANNNNNNASYSYNNNNNNTRRRNVASFGTLQTSASNEADPQT